MLLDPGMDLTLRPMRYPVFFDMYKAAIKNSWAVDEVDFSTDLTDLDRRVTPAERHLIQRLVAFCSMKVRASMTVRKPPREPSMLVSALE